MSSYTHTATISDMKAGGIAECGDIALDVNANAISYTDQNADATDAYVKYELATPASDSVRMPASLPIEDFSLDDILAEFK